MNRYFFTLIGRDSAVFAKELRNIYLRSNVYNFVYVYNDKQALDQLYGRQRVIIFDAGKFGYEKHATDLKSRINYQGVYHPYVFHCSYGPSMHLQLHGVDEFLKNKEELELIARIIDRKLNN